MSVQYESQNDREFSPDDSNGSSDNDHPPVIDMIWKWTYVRFIFIKHVKELLYHS